MLIYFLKINATFNLYSLQWTTSMHLKQISQNKRVVCLSIASCNSWRAFLIECVRPSEYKKSLELSNYSVWSIRGPVREQDLDAFQMLLISCHGNVVRKHFWYKAFFYKYITSDANLYSNLFGSKKCIF